ncbi:MAG TPA: ABC transporter permease [Candidatus Limnocylindrales bacterium]|nr:ABC transporter permease [Candidatus Limnocylindrales bacterium]
MAVLQGLRALPLPVGFRAAHIIERNLIHYRRHWIIIFSGFFEPLLYLLGIGYGVGSLVPAIHVPGGQTLRYAVFVAPALMASSAMNGAVYETSFNFFFKLKHMKIFDAALTTPMGVGDVALGEIGWAVARGSVYAIGFLVVMTALGLNASPSAILALPAAMLLGFTFASIGTATTTFVRTWQDFDLVQLILLPLFLFSATFTPISLYPAPLQVVIEATPLYHGVDLIRGLTTGALGPGLVVDVAYLVVLAAIGLTIAGWRMRALLLK